MRERGGDGMAGEGQGEHDSSCGGGTDDGVPMRCLTGSSSLGGLPWRSPEVEFSDGGASLFSVAVTPQGRLLLTA